MTVWILFGQSSRPFLPSRTPSFSVQRDKEPNGQVWLCLQEACSGFLPHVFDQCCLPRWPVILWRFLWVWLDTWNICLRSGLHLVGWTLLVGIVLFDRYMARDFRLWTLGRVTVNNQDITETRMVWFNFTGGAYFWSNGIIICLGCLYGGGILIIHINCVYDVRWIRCVRDFHVLRKVYLAVGDVAE